MGLDEVAREALREDLALACWIYGIENAALPTGF